MQRRTLTGAFTTLLVAAASLTTAPAQATVTYVPKAVNGPEVTLTVKTAVERLKVAGENRYGYDRTLFKHWIDVDRDCQNTRAEVLKVESTATTNSGCTIRWGRWVSAYDGQVLTYASDLDVDHMVPLAEAWDSGARTWSTARRTAYANDLTDPRSLIAVSASSNRSKGDQDPAEWTPSRNVCNYVKQWVVVKTRWGLSVNEAERHFLWLAADHCPRTTFTTHRAVVVLVKYGSTTSGGTGGGTSGLDPRYGTCTEAKSHGYGPYDEGVDPEYAWYQDRDDDGIVCE